MTSGRFSMIFEKFEESRREQQELITDHAAIRIIYPSHLAASTEEMDEIAELRRVVDEITEAETFSRTTT